MAMGMDHEPDSISTQIEFWRDIRGIKQTLTVKTLISPAQMEFGEGQDCERFSSPSPLEVMVVESSITLTGLGRPKP